MENNGFEDLTEMTMHGTRPVDIVLKRNEPVTVWISTNAQEALFAKLPEWECWSSTIYVHFPTFSHLGYAQSSELRRLIYCPSENSRDSADKVKNGQ